MSFAPPQREVDDWISQFEERYFQPMCQGDQPPLRREARNARRTSGLCRRSVWDSIFVLVSLVNPLGVDLDAAFSVTVETNRTRDAGWDPDITQAAMENVTPVNSLLKMETYIVGRYPTSRNSARRCWLYAR
ncbi:MAG: hypothetical protein ABI718_12980 [Acidobacteriota bacterium]